MVEVDSATALSSMSFSFIALFFGTIEKRDCFELLQPFHIFCHLLSALTWAVLSNLPALIFNLGLRGAGVSTAV